jgi:hypothetical protein
VQESEELVSTLMGSMAIDLMVARLVTLNETQDDEAEAVNWILQCFHNMTEIDTKVKDALSEQAQLLKWLRRRLHPREFKLFHGNKAAAAELLAILAQVRQNGPKSRIVSRFCAPDKTLPPLFELCMPSCSGMTSTAPTTVEYRQELV